MKPQFVRVPPGRPRTPMSPAKRTLERVSHWRIGRKTNTLLRSIVDWIIVAVIAQTDAGVLFKWERATRTLRYIRLWVVRQVRDSVVKEGSEVVYTLHQETIYSTQKV